MRCASFLAVTTVLSTVVACGCSAPQNTQGEILRVRTATDVGCPIADVDVQKLAENTFVVRGCGKSVTYTCDAAAYCKEERPAGAASASAAPAPPPHP